MARVKAGKYVVGKHEQGIWLGDNATNGNISLNANQLIKATNATFESTVASTGLITAAGVDIATSAPTHGAGAIGTEVAPTTKIMSFGEEIITEIKLDLTGLFAKGGNQGDAIGLAGVNGAYLCQLKDATHGVIVKSELITIEVPTQTGNTLGADFDLITDTSATIAADGAVGEVSLLASGGATSAVGTQVESIAGHASTNNHYLYFCEGSTDAEDCTFTGGKFIIRLTGVKTF